MGTSTRVIENMRIRLSPDSWGPVVGRFRRLDWVFLFMALSLACLARLVFYPGLFGADGVNYAARALEVLRGESSHTYAIVRHPPYHRSCRH